ncbi:MAG: hypothetical protein HFF04_01255 [Oscillospiraceae bacterium]|nr:hypothetical protein [Oscillospiraceae bacterium]
MAKKDKGSFAPPALGGISLLVVFAVLCLTVFALLSLSTVRADERLSDASAQAVKNYYAADCKAQELLARLRFGETPEEVWTDGSLCGYTIPISDTQELQVEVEIRTTNDYTILRWQAVPIGEWGLDEGLDLWDGETLF